MQIQIACSFNYIILLTVCMCMCYANLLCPIYCYFNPFQRSKRDAAERKQLLGPRVLWRCSLDAISSRCGAMILIRVLIMNLRKVGYIHIRLFSWNKNLQKFSLCIVELYSEHFLSFGHGCSIAMDWDSHSGWLVPIDI